VKGSRIHEPNATTKCVLPNVVIVTQSMSSLTGIVPNFPEAGFWPGAISGLPACYFSMSSIKRNVKKKLRFDRSGSVVASPVGKRRSIRTVAQQQPNDSSHSRVKTKPFQEEKRQKPKPSSGDCVNRLAQVQRSKSRTTGRQTDGSTG
jgi:hypothetical protein